MVDFLATPIIPIIPPARPSSDRRSNSSSPVSKLGRLADSSAIPVVAPFSAPSLLQVLPVGCSDHSPHNNLDRLAHPFLPIRARLAVCSGRQTTPWGSRTSRSRRSLKEACLAEVAYSASRISSSRNKLARPVGCSVILASLSLLRHPSSPTRCSSPPSSSRASLAA